MPKGNKTPDMMKDFRAFNLRKQDIGYETKLKYYGDISERYTFIELNSSDPEPFSNLLDEIYCRQYNSHFLHQRGEPDYSRRYGELITLNLSPEQSNKRIANLADRLKTSINEKEDAEKYLVEKYLSVLSEHKKISLFSFAFYLSDEWVERHEKSDYRFSFESFQVSLDELKRRFDTMIKIMKSNSEYTHACAYIRVILLDELCRPYYFVIFFFKGDEWGDYFPKEIWYQWLNSAERGARDSDQLGAFYPFNEKHIPEREKRHGLMVFNPGDGIKSEYDPVDVEINFLDEIKGRVCSEKTSLLKDNKSGHLAFFHFLARRINKIHPNKALVFSGDFTYLTNKEKKEQAIKRKSEKEREVTEKGKSKSIKRNQV